MHRGTTSSLSSTTSNPNPPPKPSASSRTTTSKDAGSESSTSRPILAGEASGPPATVPEVHPAPPSKRGRPVPAVLPASTNAGREAGRTRDIQVGSTAMVTGCGSKRGATVAIGGVTEGKILGIGPLLRTPASGVVRWGTLPATVQVLWRETGGRGATVATTIAGGATGTEGTGGVTRVRATSVGTGRRSTDGILRVRRHLTRAATSGGGGGRSARTSTSTRRGGRTTTQTTRSEAQ